MIETFVELSLVGAGFGLCQSIYLIEPKKNGKFDFIGCFPALILLLYPGLCCASVRLAFARPNFLSN